MAGHEVIRLDLNEFRLFAAAQIGRIRAAAGEAASLGRVDRRGNFAREQDAFLLAVNVGHRDGGKQSLRVGMQRLFEESFGRSLFNHAAQVHNGEK